MDNSMILLGEGLADKLFALVWTPDRQDKTPMIPGVVKNTLAYVYGTVIYDSAARKNKTVKLRQMTV